MLGQNRNADKVLCFGFLVHAKHVVVRVCRATGHGIPGHRRGRAVVRKPHHGPRYADTQALPQADIHLHHATTTSAQSEHH